MDRAARGEDLQEQAVRQNNNLMMQFQLQVQVQQVVYMQMGGQGWPHDTW
jgi:hypothetical protein